MIQLQLGTAAMSLLDFDNSIGSDIVDLTQLRGQIRLNESMKKHVSWRAGGNARYFYLPKDCDDLSRFLSLLPRSIPVYMVGLGSNLLVRDGGFNGAIVGLHAKLNDLFIGSMDSREGSVFAGAGVPCAKLARFAGMKNLVGSEFLAGIPGTVGGALAMNAGCYGGETWDLVERVQVIDRAGNISERRADDYRIGYRSVARKQDIQNQEEEEWFVGAWFRLITGNGTTSMQKIKKLLTMRISTQPLNYPNAGSVFRNPEGDYAARLIENANLKGLRVGGAMVSTKHANFIINTGNATATDIEAVIYEVQHKVKERTGVSLVREVRIIGDTVVVNK